MKTFLAYGLLILSATVSLSAADPLDDAILQRLKIGIGEYEQAVSSLAAAQTAVVSATATTEFQKAKIVREIRAAVIGDGCTIVRPSGVDDSAALQAAIDAKQWVFLSGVYTIKTPLTVIAPARLIGASGQATIHYAGAPTNRPVITVDGANGESTGLHNLIVYGYHKARGVKFYRCCQPNSASNIWIRDAITVGLDLVDCWVGRFSGIRVSTCRGVTLRTYRFNNGVIDGLDISSCSAFWPTDMTTPTAANSANIAMTRYMCEHGIVAARAHYGAELHESWPTLTTKPTGVEAADSDAWVPEANRALIVLLQGSTQRFTNVTVQASYCGDFPVIHSQAQGARFEQFYTEYVWCKDAAVVLDGHSPNGWGACNHTFQDCNLDFGTDVLPNTDTVGKPLYFVRCEGYARNTHVDQVLSVYGAIAKGMIRTVGTGNTNAVVERLLCQDVGGNYTTAVKGIVEE